MIAACAFCGRDNETGSRFCMDCGKPLDPAAARAIPSYNPAAAVPVHAGAGAPARPPVAVTVAAAEAADLTEVALACGFSSHSHFTSVFKRQLGVTPSVFAARLLSGFHESYYWRQPAVRSLVAQLEALRADVIIAHENGADSSRTASSTASSRP